MTRKLTEGLLHTDLALLDGSKIPIHIPQVNMNSSLSNVEEEKKAPLAILHPLSSFLSVGAIA